MNAILTDARRGHAGLFWFAIAMGGLAVVLAALAVVDQRVLLGAPLWFKPLKFAISFAAYCGALAWMLGQLRAPALRRTGWLIVAAAVIEIVIITVQAGRGLRSHFNDDDGSGEMLYAIMGVTVAALYLAAVVVALRFLREPRRDAATGWAIRLGLLVGLVGMAVGGIMVGIESHAVGVPDGGPGLPLVGWSTTAGDLRIAHFVGMHALQLLPLLAAGLVALDRRGSGRLRLDDVARSQVVIAVAGGYTGLVVLLTWQALRAQPLLAPDGLTLAALAALVLGTGAALLLATRGAARRAAPQVLA